MLQFVDGFDYCDQNGALAKYTSYGSFLFLNVIPGLALHLSGVADGNAMALTNTAGNPWSSTRIMRPSPKWWVGFRLFPTFRPGALEPGIIMRLESDPSNPDATNAHCQLLVAVDAAGQLQFYSHVGSGGFSSDGTDATLGILISHPTPFPALVPGVWSPYIEISIGADTGRGIEVRFDGVPFMSFPTLSIGEPGRPIDRVSLYWEHGTGHGYAFDDLYICDAANDSAGNPQDFLGPVHITAHFPLSDTGNNRFAAHGSITDAGCVRDNPSDGDATYIDGSGGNYDFFSLSEIPCYGLILGVAANATARRRDAGTPAQLQLQVRPDGRGNVSFDPYDLLPAYSIAHRIAGEYSLVHSPQRWNAGEVHNGYWGLSVPGSGVARVTQYFVEVMTSLSPRHYDCGIGHYAF